MTALNKKYKLTFEENFENVSSGWEIVESSETVKNDTKSDRLTKLLFFDEKEREISGDIVARYSKENVSFEKGKLILKADKENEGFSGSAIKYTGRKFGKGLLEVKAKLPKNMPGIWPKIYLQLQNKIASASVEFAQVKGIEHKGKIFFEMQAYCDTEHGRRGNKYLHSGLRNWPSFYPPLESDDTLSDDWHIFGYEQTNTEGIFYVDGIECLRIDISHPIFVVFDAEGELNISLGINRPEIEPCDENTKLPCEIIIEYVKFYEEVK
ncbi:MAG: glycosyl hydrolase family protein [Ruminococcaceae bacterium]|nr:glycosyl hydrolase family protein [Oscillospiraceae bacterium]